MVSTTKNYEAAKVIFAAPINQEFASNVVEVAHEYGVSVGISKIGCTPELLGIYAEFASKALKKVFLEEIAGTYNPEFVWTT